MDAFKALLTGALAVLLVACSSDEPATTATQPAPTSKLISAPAPALPEISPVLPTKESFGGKVTIPSLQHDFDVFSWESFIALNWPAKPDGSADTSVTIGQAPGAMRVWQHYKESRDIFLPSGATPPGWNQANPPPDVCPAEGGTIVLNQPGKTPNVLDESGEPFQTGPLIDQNGQYARFEILTNQVMFDYIVQHQLYSQAGQASFGDEANFPFSTDSAVGSIMLKAAWKIIGDNDDPARFFTTQAYVYDNPNENRGVKAHCELKTVGLVGLHIGTKVEGNPQWIWSTFEHVANVPTQGQPAEQAHYNFFNPNCGDDCPPVNEPPPRPWNPATPHTQPGQIERVIPIDDATRALNQSYHQALQAAVPDTVWVNYELVSTQWPTDAQSTTDPTGVPAPMFLANTTLETYIQGTVRQTSSSCIQCHNNATMTTGKFSDFTYLLQRAE